MRVDGETCEEGPAARDEGPATPTTGRSSGAAGNHVIDAHRFLLCLRSDPMRAMLRSGKSRAGTLVVSLTTCLFLAHVELNC